MNLLKKIEALFSVEAPAPVAIVFKDVKAQDGSVLRITEEIAVGSKVEVINEDGTLSVPTSPEVILEDGTVVSIDAEGIITEVKAAEAEAEDAEEMEAPAEPAKEDAPAEEEPTADDSKRIDALEVKVEELINAVNGLIEALQGKETEMEVVKKENEELSKLASASPANFKKFDKQIEIKIAVPEDDSTMSRLLKRKK